MPAKFTPDEAVSTADAYLKVGVVFDDGFVIEAFTLGASKNPESPEVAVVGFPTFTAGLKRIIGIVEPVFHEGGVDLGPVKVMLFLNESVIGETGRVQDRDLFGSQRDVILCGIPHKILDCLRESARQSDKCKDQYSLHQNPLVFRDNHAHGVNLATPLVVNSNDNEVVPGRVVGGCNKGTPTAIDLVVNPTTTITVIKPKGCRISTFFKSDGHKHVDRGRCIVRVGDQALYIRSGSWLSAVENLTGLSKNCSRGIRHGNVAVAIDGTVICALIRPLAIDVQELIEDGVIAGTIVSIKPFDIYPTDSGCVNISSYGSGRSIERGQVNFQNIDRIRGSRTTNHNHAQKKKDKKTLHKVLLYDCRQVNGRVKLTLFTKAVQKTKDDQPKNNQDWRDNTPKGNLSHEAPQPLFVMLPSLVRGQVPQRCFKDLTTAFVLSCIVINDRVPSQEHDPSQESKADEKPYNYRHNFTNPEHNRFFGDDINKKYKDDKNDQTEYKYYTCNQSYSTPYREFLLILRGFYNDLLSHPKRNSLFVKGKPLTTVGNARRQAVPIGELEG